MASVTPRPQNFAAYVESLNALCETLESIGGSVKNMRASAVRLGIADEDTIQLAHREIMTAVIAFKKDQRTVNLLHEMQIGNPMQRSKAIVKLHQQLGGPIESINVAIASFRKRFDITADAELEHPSTIIATRLEFIAHAKELDRLRKLYFPEAEIAPLVIPENVLAEKIRDHAIEQQKHKQQ